MDLFLSANGAQKKKIVFGSPPSDKSTSSQDELAPYRIEIIRQFIHIAKKYMAINLIESIPPNTHCPGCEFNLAQIASDENGIQRCPHCYFERSLPSKGYCSSTSATMETMPQKTSRNENEEKENFTKARIRYEGRQKEKFPYDLFTKLDDYFTQHNMPTGQHIISSGEGTISRERMFIALSHIGYPLYEHVNLILHKYINAILPDISHLDGSLDLHFDLTHKVAQEMKLAPMNTQFRLFKHLEMLGYPVNISDFRVPKTRELLEINQETWRIMCEYVDDYGKSIGIKYIQSI